MRFCLTFNFSIYVQQVILNERKGKSETDEDGLGWDSFDLKSVDTSSVKIEIETVYSTKNNGFIEVEFYAGIFI